MSGKPCFFFAGGLADQDAELMLAFALFEDARTDWLKTTEQRKEDAAKLEQTRKELLGG